MRTYVMVKRYTRATYGWNTRFRVYRIKKNKLEWVTKGRFQNGANRGDESEAFIALINCGELPKSWYAQTDGYIHRCKADIRIHVIDTDSI